MDKNELKKRLYLFNDDEIFYREYYHAHKQKWELEEFLAQQDTGEILKRRLFIPEISHSLIPQQMADQDYFKLSSKTSVYLSKHNRYTPAFHHRHDFYEIIYVLDGTCSQTFKNDELSLNTGDFCLLAPDTLHSTGVFNDSVVINILIRRSTFDDIFYNLLREPNLISTFFNQTLYQNRYHDYLLFCTGRDGQIQDYVLDMFLEQLNQEKYCSTILNSMLMILFSRILRQFENTARFPAFHRKYGEEAMAMLSYIQDHFQNLTLTDLAEHFHLSVSYCSRHIKELTGNSFSTLLRQIRLERAKALLRDTNLSITEISRIIGYENPEHFCRIFKTTCGITPGKFRT